MIPNTTQEAFKDMRTDAEQQTLTLEKFFIVKRLNQRKQ